MQIYQAIILGAIQGATEFLPISSSGHLILAQRLFGTLDVGLLFDVLLHLATLLPIFIIFYKDVLALFKKPYRNLVLLIIATFPCIITGLLLQDNIERFFYNGTIFSAILLSSTFLLTAFLMLVCYKRSKKPLVNTLNAKRALMMGVFQSVALLPGLSRSGTVLTGGTLAGLNKEENAKFTFLMSIPVVLGAVLLSGIKAVGSPEKLETLPVLFGMLSAFTTGYISIEAMLKIVKKANYKIFAIYLTIISILSLALKVFFGV